MDNKHDLEIAVDFSGPCVNACLREINSHDIVLKVNRLMQRREAALICDILQQALDEKNIKWSDICKFTVGSGPGSFTGMRIAAAFISGITFGKKSVITRTIPSAFAIAKSANLQENENAAILFDGRNKEIILFEVIAQSDKIVATKREAILNREQCVEYFKSNKFEKVVTVKYDQAALELILPEEEFSRLIVVDEVNSEFLLADNLGEFDNDLTNLHYIRPSVISK